MSLRYAKVRKESVTISCKHDVSRQVGRPDTLDQNTFPLKIVFEGGAWKKSKCAAVTLHQFATASRSAIELRLL